MPRLFVPAVFALVAASLATSPAAHQEPATSPKGASQATQQPPPAQNPPAGQPQQGQQPPVFRGEIDVIRLDVSVLDKDRHPVRGLTADDFTVLEDGKPQRLVAVSEVEAATNDPRLSAWMRHTPSDIATNDLADQMGDGRAFGLIMDDWNIPFDDLNIVMSAREVGRYVIDQLGPSDIAAVIFPQQAGRTQDFTDDRGKLITAIDKFDPPEMRWLEATPQGTGGGGDMPHRYSSALARTTCLRSQPAVPALETLVLGWRRCRTSGRRSCWSAPGCRSASRPRARCHEHAHGNHEGRVPHGAAVQHQHLHDRSGGLPRVRGSICRRPSAAAGGRPST